MFPPYSNFMGGFGSGVWQNTFVVRRKPQTFVDEIWQVDADKRVVTQSILVNSGIPYAIWASTYGLNAGGWAGTGLGIGYKA